MKTETKDKILHAAAEIIHRKGFNNTGIQEILNSASVPKGSFYFYFKNKDDLGLQLVDHFLDLFIFLVDETLKTNIKSIEQLRLLFDRLLNIFEASSFMGGCPIGNLAQESGALSDVFRVKLNETFDIMRRNIAKFIENAVSNNELPESTDIDEMAGFILNSWEGAILQMKVAKNTASFRVFNRIIFDKVLK